MIDHSATPLTDPEATRPPWDDLETVLRHAEQALADRDSARAFAFYARATELDSNHASAWAGRAATASEIDDEIISWSYALALAPDNIQAHIRLEQAVADKIEASERADAPALFALARELAEAGHKQVASRLVIRATDLDDTKEEYWVWRAGLADDPKETISALNQALALNPENERAQAGLLWALAQQAKDARPASSTALEEARQFLAEGRALTDKGDRDLAHEMFKRATELDQHNEEAWFLRGASIEDTDVDEALTCMEQALAINPDNEPAKEKRSWLRVRKLRQVAVTRKETRPTSTSSAAPVKPGKPIRPQTIRVAMLVVAIIVLVVLMYFVLRST